MSVSGVLKNVREKGIKKTWEIYQYNRRYKQAFHYYSQHLVWGKDVCDMRPNDQAGLAAFRKAAAALEEKVRKSDHAVYVEGLREIKAGYIKKIIPAIYLEESKNPVTNTVIFMESGNSPSPSSHYIAKVMEAEAKYQVRKIGLKIRQVTEVEFYENACGFIGELATARAVFLSTANSLLSHFDVRPETKVIQLWHGAGIFKKIGYSTVDNMHFGLNRAEREEYDQYRNYSYVTIPAMEQAWIYEDAMHISRESGKLVPTGVSRTDVFYDPEYISESYETFYNSFPLARGKKIIIYVPTFRGTVAGAQAPDQLDHMHFAEKLQDDYILLIKHHGLSKNIPPIPEELEDKFAFDMNKHKILGIERLLTIADICITDYSSLAFEYAILERPILFFAYDLEDYIDQRGMYYDYAQITPGPICRTNEELTEAILRIEEHFDPAEIKAFKKKYVCMCDGHATERTLALLESD